MNKKIFGIIIFLLSAVMNLYPQVWAEITHFDDPEYEGLGNAVAIDGNIAIAGASRYNGFQGCAYVMEYNSSDTTWQKVARLTASDSIDRFGFSVDISGDYIVVGAPFDDDDGEESGSAYVFEKPATGWADMTETAKLKPFDGNALNGFGVDVAIHGETILIGAPGKNQSVNYPGYAYLFEKPASGWENISGGTKLEDPDGDPGDFFGTSVAVSDEAFAIGAVRADTTGTVHVFTHPVDTWVHTSKLSPTHKQVIPGLAFGTDIDIQDDVIVTGAPGAGWLKGRAYVFEKPSGGWVDMTQTAVLTASDRTDLDKFGVSVNIYNDTILIGSSRNDAPKAVYLYKKPATGWENSTEMVQILAPENSDNFGYQVGLDNGNLMIGNDVHFYKFLTFNPVHVTAHPDDSIRACLNSQVNFSITASNARAYQWQVSNDNGDTYTNITNDTIYSSATTSTLEINVYQELEQHVYRCIASNPQYADTSGAGVLILDDEAPTIIAQPSDRSIYAGSGCQAELPDYHGVIEATDNCVVDTVIQSPPAGTLVTGATNPVTFTVVDEMKNEATVGFNVSVIDSTKPDLQPNVANLNVYANEDCVGILPDYGGIIQAIDNCDDTLDVVQSPSSSTEISDSAMVTVTFTDQAGNFVDTSFWAFVIDTLPPVILSSHEDVVLPGGDGCEAELPDYTGDVLARENCSASVGVVQLPSPGTTVTGAFNTVVLKVSDEFGNIAEVSFEASVQDTVSPSIACAGDTIINLQEGETTYLVQDTKLDPVVVEDNCGFTMVSNDFQTGLTLKDAEIPGGTHTITWTVQDGAGNKATCSSIITVNLEGTSIFGLTGALSLFPNPTKGIIHCRFDEDIPERIIITNLAGQVLHAESWGNTNGTIDISNLSKGVYLLNMEFGDRESTWVKVMKN